MIPHAAGFRQGLHLDDCLAASQAVPAPEQPHEGIIDAGFPRRIVPGDHRIGTVKIQLQIFVTLEVLQPQRPDANVFHCLSSLFAIELCDSAINWCLKV